jgi:arylsulfatase A-like enzyme
MALVILSTTCALLSCRPGLADQLAKTSVKSTGQRPNILIIFTDDQGYGDIGCYGNKKNRTPRLDQLAKQGTRFTSFYAQTVCGPSRSALLTGRYPIRSKGWGMPASEITFAELMRKSGYQTACIGKWDVSNRKPIIERMPNAQGFDYYFGTLGANDGGGVTFHENNTKAGSTRDMGSLTTLYTDKAIEYLQDRRDANKPFALYVAHTMMHTIIDASDRFRGKSAGGLYGDVVEEFDYETGRLLDALDQLDLSKNTLVIYTSDNGPWNQDKYTKRKKGHPAGSIFWGDSGPLRNGKGSPYEGGYRLPCIVRWPGKVPAANVSDAAFATIDFMPTFAKLTDFKVPADRRIDGIDQSDLLLGKRNTGRENFYFHEAGVRQGKWKYLKAQAFFHGYAVENDRVKVEELYDLEADVGERTNLAAKHPQKVAELRELMRSIEARDKLAPSDNNR